MNSELSFPLPPKQLIMKYTLILFWFSLISSFPIISTNAQEKLVVVYEQKALKYKELFQSQQDTLQQYFPALKELSETDTIIEMVVDSAAFDTLHFPKMLKLTHRWVHSISKHPCICETVCRVWRLQVAIAYTNESNKTEYWLGKHFTRDLERFLNHQKQLSTIQFSDTYAFTTPKNLLYLGWGYGKVNIQKVLIVGEEFLRKHTKLMDITNLQIINLSDSDIGRKSFHKERKEDIVLQQDGMSKELFLINNYNKLVIKTFPMKDYLK